MTDSGPVFREESNGMRLVARQRFSFRDNAIFLKSVFLNMRFYDGFWSSFSRGIEWYASRC